jgi:hypothetical protein
MFDPQTPGIVTRGLIAIRHIEREPPTLTFPVGTYWLGQPSFPLPDGVYVENLGNTSVREQTDLLERECAQLETLRWQTVITSPMPHRILLALDTNGGELVGTQPELATLMCVSLDSFKRGIAHYRALQRVKTVSGGIRLEGYGQPQRQLFDTAHY